MLGWKNSVGFMTKRLSKKSPLFDDERKEKSSNGALFTSKQLRRLARTIALRHRDVKYGRSDWLLKKLRHNNATLRDFNSRTLALKNASLVPADEWLTDNFYLIEEHIRLAFRHFPRKYNRELPCVSEGRFEGLPMVYALVVEFLSHVDFEFEIDSLSSFIRAYQTGIKMKIGELWAVPIMLRLALIDNLADIAARLLQTRKERGDADLWLERLKKTAVEQPSGMVTVLAEMEKSDIAPSPAFMSEFAQNLSSQNAALHMARNWLEQRLAEDGLTIEESIRAESQMQAAEQVEVSHCIASLRLLGTADWKNFVESLSVVDAILREDPARIYEQADFATRDACRHRVEKLAKRCPVTEAEIARQAVDLAKRSQDRRASERESHVGYYLLGDGCELLEQAIGAKPTCGKICERVVRRFPLTFYLGGAYF